MQSNIKKARIFAIIQLCLAFSMVAWSSLYPFAQEYFALKSKAVLYEFALGRSGPGIPESLHGKLERNAVRFRALPQEDQIPILDAYSTLQKDSSISLTEKFMKALRFLIFGLSPFALAWTAFSIVIAVFILLRIEGATQAALLLPILVLAYGLECYYQKPITKKAWDSALFPSEDTLVADYLKKPLSKNITEQKLVLTQAWHTYLIENWAHQKPSESEMMRAQQLEQGEFAFNLARLQEIAKEDSMHTTAHAEPSTRSNDPLPVIVLYFLWNSFFVWGVRNWSFPLSAFAEEQQKQGG